MVSVVRSQLSLWSAGGLYCRGRGRCCVASSDGGPAGRKVSTSGSSTNESVGDRSCWGRQLVLRLMLKDCRRRLPCLPVCLVRCSGPPLWLWRPPIPASSAEMASRHGALDRTRLLDCGVKPCVVLPCCDLRSRRPVGRVVLRAVNADLYNCPIEALAPAVAGTVPWAPIDHGAPRPRVL